MNLKLIYNTSRKLHQYRKVKKIRAADKKKDPGRKEPAPESFKKIHRTITVRK